MAKVGDTFNILPIFPQNYGEYYLEFSPEEESLLQKYTDPHFSAVHSTVTDGYEGPVQSSDEFFQIMYARQNLINNNPEFTSLKNTMMEIANHYLTVGLGLRPPEGCYMGISDSWFIKLQGGTDKPQDPGLFRKHNHCFSFLSAVLYLQSSDNGFYFTDDHFMERMSPFCWDKNENWANTTKEYVKPERGKLVIFHSDMYHALHMSENENDTRYSIVCNFWPMGNVSEYNSALLSYTDKMNDR